MVNIYLGCDLFIEGQRIQATYVEDLINEAISDKVNIYNPAKNLEINDKSAGFASGSDILLADYERLRNSDILIALMDTNDLGLAAEMGIAFERNIPIFQLYTDIRLTGNDKEDKFDEMKKDIFQNDFLYINKLVTGLSYVDKNGNKYQKPLIYQNVKDLVSNIVDIVDEKGF